MLEQRQGAGGGGGNWLLGVLQARGVRAIPPFPLWDTSTHGTASPQGPPTLEESVPHEVTPAALVTAAGGESSPASSNLPN